MWFLTQGQNPAFQTQNPVSTGQLFIELLLWAMHCAEYRPTQ